MRYENFAPKKHRRTIALVDWVLFSKKSPTAPFLLNILRLQKHGFDIGC